MKKTIYLDNAATTKTRPEEVEAMLPYFTEFYGNPSSIYSFSDEPKKAVAAGREAIAKSIGAKTNELYFTGGGSESDNWALKATAEAYKSKGNHIITSKIEHHAILHTCEYLEKERGAKVTYLDVDENGFIDLDELQKAITPETILISVMAANNEIGTLEPLKEIGQIAHEHGILFHTDAVQAFGQIPINVDEFNIDMLSSSGHKINGPKGIGFLYIRKGVKIRSFVHGGAQERKRRAGTENVPGIVGYGLAAERANKSMKERTAKEIEIRDHMISRILTEIPYVRLNGDKVKRLPNNVNVSIQFIEGESLLLMLDNFGICASSGSACTSGSLDPSHVLLAIGLPHEIAHGSLRMTLSEETTMEDVDFVVDKLKDITANLRSNAGKLVDSGLKLMLNLAKGIAKAMPDIIKNVPQIVINIAGVINDNAPKILLAGVQLIAILLKGLIQSIPTLIANVPKIVQAIVSVFTAYNWLSLGKSLITGIKNGIMNAKNTAVDAMKNTYNGLIDAIKNLPSKLKGLGENGIKGIGNGITGKLSGLKTTAGKILTNIIEAVKNLPKELSKKATSAIRDMKTTFKNVDWGSVGMNVVKGIAKGVGDFAWILVDKMTGLAQKAWEGVKDFFGIHSPSRLMRDTVGKMIPAGITVGLEKAFPDTLKTLMNQSEQLANVPFRTPEIATGKIIPAKASAVIAQKQNSTNSNNNDVLNLLEQLLSVTKSLESDNSGNNGGDYHFTAQINRRTLFDEFIEEAKLRQMSNGRNPFSLA